MCANDEITHLLRACSEQGVASDKLITAVYGELHRLAKSRLSGQPPHRSLQATALVNEAYAKLFSGRPVAWANRRHFFAAAAEVMRHVMVDRARRKNAAKRGGGRVKARLEDFEIEAPGPSNRVLQLHAALDELAQCDSAAAEMVKLRYFVQLTMKEAAEVMGISVRTGNRIWSFARAWLHEAIDESSD